MIIGLFITKHQMCCIGLGAHAAGEPIKSACIVRRCLLTAKLRIGLVGSDMLIHTSPIHEHWIMDLYNKQASAVTR